jgi:hypothetical protein
MIEAPDFFSHLARTLVLPFELRSHIVTYPELSPEPAMRAVARDTG